MGNAPPSSSKAHSGTGGGNTSFPRTRGRSVRPCGHARNQFLSDVASLTKHKNAKIASIASSMYPAPPFAAT